MELRFYKRNGTYSPAVVTMLKANHFQRTHCFLICDYLNMPWRSN